MLRPVTILKDFAMWSTITTLRNMAIAEKRWIFIFWTAAFVILTLMFVLQLLMLVFRYVAFEADIQTVVVFEEHSFPRVTFCNMNMMKWNVVRNNSKYAEISELMDQFYAIRYKNDTTVPDKYGLRGKRSYEQLARAQDMLYLLAAKLPTSEKEAAFYQFNDLVTECLFHGMPCSPKDFVVHYDPVYGKCYTYVKNHTITHPGSQYGLRLLMVVQQQRSVTSENDYLPTTPHAGLRLIVYDKAHSPEMYGRGVDVGSGYMTTVGMEKNMKYRLKRPYGNCVDRDASSGNFYSNSGNYSIEQCFLSCLQRETFKRCGCATPKIRKADDMKLCETIPEMECLQLLKGNQLNATARNINPLVDCDCFPPCWETYYTTTISSSIYPSNRYQVAVGTTQQNEALLVKMYGTKIPPTTIAGPSATEQQSSPTSQGGFEVLNTTASPSPSSSFSTEPESSNGTSSTTPSSDTTVTLTSDTTTSTDYQTTTTSTDYETTTTTVEPLCPNLLNFTSQLPTCIRLRGFKKTPTKGCSWPEYELIDEGSITDWHQCFPCYYRCWENGIRSTYPDPVVSDIRCDDFFLNAFLHIGNRLKPTWDNNLLGTDPTNGACPPTGSLKRKREAEDFENLPGVGSCEWWNLNFASVQECMTWYKKNGLLLYVYFQTLSYELHEETPSYTISMMLADLGGHAGLWLGLSVVSVVECLALVGMLVLFCLCGAKFKAYHAKAMRKDEEFMRDEKEELHR